MAIVVVAPCGEYLSLVRAAEVAEPHLRPADSLGRPRRSDPAEWLIGALTRRGVLYGSCLEPRIDANSVSRLYPGGPTRGQLEALRLLMMPQEFDRVS